MKIRILFLFAVLMVHALASAQDTARELAGSPRLFEIDPQTPRGLQEVFQPTGEPLPFVSAHRGGAHKGLPENCIATFENTLRHTFALMEIDPRYTKDGVIVVHHDATLDRTTTGKGRVADFTLSELKQLRLKDNEGNVTPFQIPTLDEVLEWARGRTIVVLDQEDVPATERVKRISQLKAEAYAMVIVMSFKDVQSCHAINPNVMMEVMIPNREKAEQFDQLGVPWRNVVAFVGHTPPQDVTLYEFVHRKGASCMIGTSRNLDRKIASREVTDVKQLEPDYRAFLRRGADIIETDIPTKLGPLIQAMVPIPSSKKEYFHAK